LIAFLGACGLNVARVAVDVNDRSRDAVHRPVAVTAYLFGRAAKSGALPLD
jgi:hypothetical protein